MQFFSFLFFFFKARPSSIDDLRAKYTLETDINGLIFKKSKGPSHMAMLQGFSTEFDVSFQDLLAFYKPQIFCHFLNTENSLIPPWKPAETCS